MAVYSTHLCRPNSYPLRPRRVTWINTKSEGVKSCKANKCSDVRTGCLGVLTTHKTPPCLDGAGSTRQEWRPPQVQASKFKFGYLSVNRNFFVRPTRPSFVHVGATFLFRKSASFKDIYRAYEIDIRWEKRWVLEKVNYKLGHSVEAIKAIFSHHTKARVNTAHQNEQYSQFVGELVQGESLRMQGRLWITYQRHILKNHNGCL